MRALFIILMVLSGYFLPFLVANHRKHPDQMSIFILNLLLGWTAIGWIIALVWSAKSIRQTN